MAFWQFFKRQFSNRCTPYSRCNWRSYSAAAVGHRKLLRSFPRKNTFNFKINFKFFAAGGIFVFSAFQMPAKFDLTKYDFSDPPLTNPRHVREKIVVETLVPGDGVNFPKEGQIVYIEYLLKDIERASIIETSRGHAPLRFVVGSGEVIPGLDIAVRTLSVGERATVLIPPFLAYGEGDPERHIRPNCVVVADIILLKLVSENGDKIASTAELHSKFKLVHPKYVELDQNTERWPADREEQLEQLEQQQQQQQLQEQAQAQADYEKYQKEQEAFTRKKLEEFRDKHRQQPTRRGFF